MRAAAAASLCALALLSCHADKNEEQAETAAQNFAQLFFGCRYSEAAQLCTPESQRWIKYVATNVTDSDLAVLNAATEEPSYDIDDLSLDNDSAATCTVTAHHYLLMHDIGASGHMADEGCYTLRLTRQNGKWLVALDGVPHPDKGTTKH